MESFLLALERHNCLRQMNFEFMPPIDTCIVYVGCQVFQAAKGQVIIDWLHVWTWLLQELCTPLKTSSFSQIDCYFQTFFMCQYKTRLLKLLSNAFWFLIWRSLHFFDHFMSNFIHFLIILKTKWISWRG